MQQLLSKIEELINEYADSHETTIDFLKFSWDVHKTMDAIRRRVSNIETHATSHKRKGQE